MADSERSNSGPDRPTAESPPPTGDDAELAELIQQHEADKARLEAERGPAPRRMGAMVRRAVPQTAPPLTRPSDEELEQRRREREEVARRRAIGERASSLVASRGERYANCALENYRAETPEQNAAVAVLMEFVEQMGRLIRREGQGGLILYGPRGTGKDHLLMACMLQAVRHSELTVRWCNGMDLLGDIRDRIQTGEQESQLIRSMAAPDVLAISDPLPPFGSLTEFQATMLFRVIDARYSRRKPIWVTVNVANRAEFEQRMGAQLVDRLIDGALVVYCNWPSFREVRKRP